MNINNLHTGQIFKNYKELCNALEIEPKEGNSKVKHFNDLAQWCEFEKDGRKIIINRVFENKKDRVETRGGANRSIYGELIQLLLLKLIHRNGGSVTLTKNMLFEELGMVNINYRKYKVNTKNLAEYLGMNVDTVLDFYNINGNNFKNTIVSALDRLMDKRVLFYNTVIRVKELSSNKHRDATPEELSIISLVENKSLEKFGFEYISEARTSTMWHEFKKHTVTMIHGLTDVDYYYTAYKIFSDKENVENEGSKLEFNILSQDEFRETIIKLNSLILENIDINAKKRHEKAKVDIQDSDVNEITYVRCDESYTDNINTLADKLINYKTDDISKDVSSFLYNKHKEKSNN